MKTKKYLQLTLCICIIIVAGFSACKKDRVVQDDYQSMDSFYNQYKEEEQEYVIDSTGSCPLICKKETKLCTSADILKFPTGSTTVTYPFILKVVELYSMKDMLLWRAPSVAGSTVLETSAEIRVRAFKGSTELQLKPSATYYMGMDSMPNQQSNMKIYYGSVANNIIGWSNSASPVSIDSGFYELNVANAGWVSAARQHSSASTTAITLAATGTNTQNIEVYLVFANFKGLMKVSSLVSGSVPVGEQVTLFAMAKNQNNDYMMDQQIFTVTANQQITLNMQVVSEAGLLAALAGL